MITIPLSGIPLYVCDTDRRLSEQENTILCSQSEKTTGAENTVFVSVTNKFLDTPELYNLKMFCEEHLQVYTKEVLKIKQNFKITSSWTTRTPMGSNHHKHNHPNSIFSGVFYANASSGDIVFDLEPTYSKDFKFPYDVLESNVFNSTSWKVPARTGLVVIFPSWLQHYTQTNSLDYDRRIIGFNAFLCDGVGEYDTNEYLTIKI